MDTIISLITKINHIEETTYFTTLKQNPSRELFIKSQESFINAVDTWSRILGILLAKVPLDIHRAVILENLNDEHGNGDITRSHVNTFKLFMQSMGQNDIQLYNKQSETYDSVEWFTNIILSALHTENWIYCVSLLGMIEYTYKDIGKCIHNYAKIFMLEERINHYSLHETMDLKHSYDLFQLVSPYITTNYNDIEDGLEMGYFLISSLYDLLSDQLTPNRNLSIKI